MGITKAKRTKQRKKKQLPSHSRVPGVTSAKPNKPGLLIRNNRRQSADAALDWVVRNYGTKAAGMMRIPPAWCPPFIAIPVWLYKEWDQKRGHLPHALHKKRGLDLSGAINELVALGAQNFIVRSSAIEESMDQRGRYRSYPVNKKEGVPGVLKAVEKIYRQFSGGNGTNDSIGVLIQPHYVPTSYGHLSNEVHVSPTRNQWGYVIEGPSYAPGKGLNSKFASSPNSKKPIPLLAQKDLPKRLRQVAHWAERQVDERCHFEWCASAHTLWLVQFDLESEISTGVDPLDVSLLRIKSRSDIYLPSADSVFSLYKVGSGTPWKKLQNVNDFQSSTGAPLPRLYFATAFAIERTLRTRPPQALADEIDELTNGRAVLRTDTINTKLSGFNLPRTFTVSGVKAVAWLSERLKDLNRKEIPLTDVCFVLHQYVPAQACAWAYFEPGNDYVQIDSLWGLPDGLQFLSHDSYYVRTSTWKVATERIRYKPRFLQEQDDGSWKYVQVARQFGRHKSLAASALRYIARETVAISDRIGSAQIMWFCNIPEELGLGKHLPWFRSRESTLS